MVIEQEDLSKAIDTLIAQGIRAGDIGKLRDAGIKNPNDLMIRTNLDLTDLTGLSDSKLDVIRKALEDMKTKASHKIDHADDEILGGGSENPLSLINAEPSRNFCPPPQLCISPCLSTQDEIGTTIVGLLFKDGIIFVCDGLSYNPVEKKFTKEDAFKIGFCKNLKVAKAGSVLLIKSLLAKFDDQVGKLLPRLTVLETAKEIVKIAKTMPKVDPTTDDKTQDPIDDKKKGIEIVIGGRDFEIMIGGFDADDDGVEHPRLAYVNKGGCYPIDTHQSIGGGAIYSQILMNNRYRNDMSHDEALKIAAGSIFRAVKHSWTTGGKVQAMVIERDKMERFEFKQP